MLDLNRRALLIGATSFAGVLFVGPRASALDGDPAASGAELTPWIAVRADGKVIIKVARSEMGQGNYTGLAMLVAEELDCRWDDVVIRYASTRENFARDGIYGAMLTGGSRSIRESHVYLRTAGAVARDLLVRAAAARWRVAAYECRAAEGVITHGPSNRTMRFAEVAEDAGALPVNDVAVKDPSQWRLLGRSVPRRDIPGKVDGSTAFAVDTRLTNLLHAAIRQCPVFGGRLASFDAARALTRRGVKRVVAFDDAVAVVADNWWRADQALADVDIVWDEGPNATLSSDVIRAEKRAALADRSAPRSREEGDVGAAFESAARVVEADYEVPFLEQATLEPQNATAWVRGDGVVEVWAPTQDSEKTALAAAEVAGVPATSVEVHKVHLGGGFGRRAWFQDYTRQAVAIAKEMKGTPVKLIWSREEDLTHSHYRPLGMARMRAALAADGTLTAWHLIQADQSILTEVRPHQVVNSVDPVQSAYFANSPYAIPNQLMQYAMRNTAVPPGFWRGVALSSLPYFRECFIDEIAHAVGEDPYAFRLPLLRDAPKDRAVLDAVAERSGWGKTMPAGHGRGIAVVASHGSYGACAIEVSVDDAGRLTVKRVISALDCGHAVHPDAIAAQIEGNVIYALGAALYGEITIENGRVAQSNFHDYPVARIADTPEIVPLLVPSGGFWGGAGETPLGSFYPALANAVFAATGRRIRRLPLLVDGTLRGA